MLNLKNAKRAILVMGAISVAIALLHTFIDQSYVGALVGISSASVFYYLHRNPMMLMAKSWAEFGELADNSRDQKFVWGFLAYHAINASSAQFRKIVSCELVIGLRANVDKSGGLLDISFFARSIKAT